jgi:uncharacterized protein YwqG
VRQLRISLLLCLIGCSQPETPAENTTAMYHPRLDIEHWKRQFPLADLEKQKGPRQFGSTKPGDPLDLWKAHGRIISSPVDLAVTEQVRARAAQHSNLGSAVPVDIFVWAIGAPEHPYLTKIGGVPHREKNAPWPASSDGKQMTFVVQFCFLDSNDIISKRLPGDVMLVYFKNADSYFGNDLQIEWSRRELAEPLRKEDCPAPTFAVPELAGVMHRTHEYPEAEGVFASLGHYQQWLFATTQSTKIGQATWFIQNDPRRKGEVLLCTFNSLQPKESWPFTNLESFVDPTNEIGVHGVRAREFDTMMFGDVGCIYFIINAKGQVRCVFDCY